MINMDPTATLIYGMLLIGVFLLYEEYGHLLVVLGLKIRLHALNAYMFFKARQMHWQLSREAGKMGVAFPPFHFVPLWERD